VLAGEAAFLHALAARKVYQAELRGGGASAATALLSLQDEDAVRPGAPVIHPCGRHRAVPPAVQEDIQSLLAVRNGHLAEATHHGAVAVLGDAQVSFAFRVQEVPETIHVDLEHGDGDSGSWFCLLFAATAEDALQGTGYEAPLLTLPALHRPSFPR